MGDGAHVVRRPLGRSGLAVTPLGFGAFKLGRNRATKYPGAYELPTPAAAAALLQALIGEGINYVDTAPAYGTSEERVGEALGSRANDVIVSTKVGESFEDGASRWDFSEAAVRASVERSRRRLGREVLDLVFIHAHGGDVDILSGTPVGPTLQSLKRDGVIRAIGFSGKTVAAERIALGVADVLMVEHNLDDRSHAEIIRLAASEGVGVVVKKGLGSGRLPAADAIEFVLGTPGVTSLVVGGLDLAHMRDNIAVADAVVRALAS